MTNLVTALARDIATPPCADPLPGALARHLVPDELWDAIRPLLTGTRRRPQGGGAPRAEDRPILAAIVYVVATGTAWRKLPPWCGITHASAYRRFSDWTSDHVWTRLLDSLGPDHDPGCWSRTVAALALGHAAAQAGRQIGRPRHAAPGEQAGPGLAGPVPRSCSGRQ